MIFTTHAPTAALAELSPISTQSSLEGNSIGLDSDADDTYNENMKYAMKPDDVEGFSEITQNELDEINDVDEIDRLKTPNALASRQLDFLCC